MGDPSRRVSRPHDRSWGAWDEQEQYLAFIDAWDVSQTRIVECDGTDVGWLRVERHRDHDWLELLAVATDAQNQGIGRAIMVELFGEATARGVPLWLSVYRSNDARRFYERLGMKSVRRDALRDFMAYGADDLSHPPRGPSAVPPDPAAIALSAALENPGLQPGRSRFSEASAIWLTSVEREVAHWESEHHIDVRVGRRQITKHRAQWRTDPRFELRSGRSDWIGFRVAPDDVSTALELIELAARDRTQG